MLISSLQWETEKEEQVICLSCLSSQVRADWVWMLLPLEMLAFGFQGPEKKLPGVLCWGPQKQTSGQGCGETIWEVIPRTTAGVGLGEVRAGKGGQCRCASAQVTTRGSLAPSVWEIVENAEKHCSTPGAQSRCLYPKLLPGHLLLGTPGRHPGPSITPVLEKSSGRASQAGRKALLASPER